MSLSETTRCHARTDVGRKRQHNEDSYLVDEQLGLFMVADGMGGHAAGEVASAIAVAAVGEVLGAHADLLMDRAAHGPQSEVTGSELLGVLEHAVQMASARIHAEAEQDRSKRGMGTTASLLLLLGPHGYVAHVGDSRIYLLRGGLVHQVTEDHTVAHELLRLGMVAPEDLAKVPRSNAITRAVGIYEHVEVDTLTLEVLPGDQFLLCSDGLSGYLGDEDEQLVQLMADADGERVVEQLIGHANDSGGKDNITAVLVRLGQGDAQDSVRARRVQLTHEVLRAMPLFSRLGERELLRVMQASQIVEYEAGAQVVSEGDDGDRMFVVLEGGLKARTGRTDLGEFGPGDHFGEMALIRNTPRSATVIALEPCAMLTIRRADFFDIVRGEPQMAVRLLWQFLTALAARLARTSRDLDDARGVLGASLAEAAFAAPAAEEDPFRGPPSGRLGQIALGYGAGVVVESSPPAQVALPTDAPELAQRVDDVPCLEEAPALATRVAAAPLESGDAAVSPPSSGLSDDERATRERIMARARQLDQLEGTVPFDARRTRPGGRLPVAAQLVEPVPKAAPGPSAEAAAPVTSPAIDRQRASDSPVADAGVASGARPPDPEGSGGAEPPAAEASSASKPAGATVPMADADGLGDELDELRRSYQRRRDGSRKGPAGKDSD